LILVITEACLQNQFFFVFVGQQQQPAVKVEAFLQDLNQAVEDTVDIGLFADDVADFIGQQNVVVIDVDLAMSCTPVRSS